MEHKTSDEFKNTSLATGEIVIQWITADKTNHAMRWIVLSTFQTTRDMSNQLTLIDAVYLFCIIMDEQEKLLL